MIRNADLSSPNDLQARARFYLLYNQPELAIEDLQAAFVLEPADPFILSDLSVAYSERGRVNGAGQDHLAALEAAELALSTAPAFKEALFNRAVALEHLCRYGDAAYSWRQYLQLDPNSAWAFEARRRLQKLTELSLWKTDSASERLDQLTQRQAMASERSADEDVPDEYRFEPSPLQAHLDGFMEAIRNSALGGRLGVALNLQRQAFRLALYLHHPEEIAHSLLCGARIELAMGGRREAKDDLIRATELLDKMPPTARPYLASVIDATRRSIEKLEARPEPGTRVLQSLFATSFFRTPWRESSDSIDGQVSELLSLQRPYGALKTLEGFRLAARDNRIAENLPPFPPPPVHSARRSPQPVETWSWSVEILDPGEEVAANESVHFPVLSIKPTLRFRAPPHTVIVAYAVVKQRLVTWVVRSSEVTVASFQPSWSDVASLLEKLKRTKGYQTRRGHLRHLYSLLVSSWKEMMQKGDRIVFVPTNSLESLPFVSLIDPSTDRFVIEDHQVVIARNSWDWGLPLGWDQRSWPNQFGTVLLIGGVSTGESGGPSLPLLRGSLQELQLIKSAYSGEKVLTLTGHQATPSRALRLLQEADIAHIGVHAFNDPNNPGASRLVLTPGEDGSGDLSVRDIFRAWYLRTRLVVLAACDSGFGSENDIASPLSLADAFLARGVPAVVASAGPVDDESTSRFMVRFHQELHRGLDPETALRKTQLYELANWEDHEDWTWASFEIFATNSLMRAWSDSAASAYTTTGE